jgi:hypothetical protein
VGGKKSSGHRKENNDRKKKKNGEKDDEEKEEGRQPCSSKSGLNPLFVLRLSAQLSSSFSFSGSSSSRSRVNSRRVSALREIIDPILLPLVYLSNRAHLSLAITFSFEFGFPSLLRAKGDRVQAFLSKGDSWLTIVSPCNSTSQ